MKLSALVVAASAAALPSAYGFSAPSRTISRPRSTSRLDMFSGGALDVEEEEDPEKRAQIEQAAKAMGMSVEEYQLGMNARIRMEDAINDLRVVGGEEGVTVERDGNMPPRHLVVTVTEAGKAMGKERLEAAIVDALKSANEKSKAGRDEAQKDMMNYISESMKKMGVY